MILIIGATGNVGAAVVQDLRARGVPARAFVRDRLRASARLGRDVELAVGDLDDPESVREAISDVSAVFLASADGPAKVEQETGVIDAAAKAGVRRIVKCSTIGAEPGSPLPMFDWHGQIEERLRASGVPAVVLRAGFYMSNLFASIEQIRHEGTLAAPVNGARIAMIDPRDVGSVAAAALTDDRHDGQSYELTGPEAVTYGQIAEELSAALARPIRFVDVPEDAARQAMLAAGLPDWLVRHLVGAYRLMRAGSLEPTTGALAAVLGREPRGFAQFARDWAGLFR